MQAEWYTVGKKVTTLAQGSIFSINNLSFDGNNEILTLEGLYPHVNFGKCKYGVVLSQTCDLYLSPPNRNPKIPYISIALLEPIASYIKDERMQGYFSHEIEWAGFKFVNLDDVEKKIAKDFEKLLQNNEPFYYFIALDSVGSKPEYYFVNLTKALPIRISNYQSLLSNSVGILKSEFANKLAWKMASLYGRIGTEDYNHKQLEYIYSNVMIIAEDVTNRVDCLPVGKELFIELKKITSSKLKDEEREKQLSEWLEKL